MKFEKYFILIFIVALGLFAGALLAIYQSETRRSIRQMNEIQMLYARQAAEELEDDLEEVVDALTQLSHSSDIVRLTSFGRREMENFQVLRRAHINSLTRIDSTGTIVYAVPMKEFIGRNISDQDHVRQSLETRKVVVSSVFTSIQGFRTIAVHVPVFDRGAYAGTLAALLRLDHTTNSRIEDIRIGKRGRAWMVNREGMVLSHPDSAMIGKSYATAFADDPDVVAAVDTILRNGEGFIQYREKSRRRSSEEVVLQGAYASAHIGNDHWIVIVSTPESQFTSPTVAMRTRLFLITLSLLIVSVLTLYLIVRYRVVVAEHRKLDGAVSTLRDRDQQISLIYDTVGDVLFRLDVEPDGGYRFTSVNKYFLTSTGLSPDQILGKRVNEVIPEPSLSMVLENYATAIREKRVVRWEEKSSYPAGVVVGEVGVAPVFDGKGTCVALVGSVHDITERKRAEETQRTLEEQVRQAQKLESIGTLASGIAHDFNNILAIILANASALERIPRESPEYKRALGSIEKAVNRGSALVRQIVMFARKGEKTSSAVDVNHLVVELCAMLDETFPKTIALTKRLDPALPPVSLNPSQLHQALLNLAVNARDAMNGEGTLTFATGVVDARDMADRFPHTKAKRYALVSVSDSGCGMTEDIRERIFEPFFTTKEQGKGTGLGLAVVYGIVHNNDGYIEVESAVNAGTTFRMYLPVSEEQTAATTAEAPAAPARARGPETILVVEDEEDLRDAVVRILRDSGYRVLTAVDGEDAVEVFRKHCDEISLVLSDQGLPRKTGMDAIRVMQTIRADVRVILASGYVDPDRKAEMAHHIRGFVHKPYRSDDVLNAVRAALDT